MAKILVVEDDLSLQMIYEINLKRLGHEMLMAKTVHTAISAINENPDLRLVILDHQLVVENTKNLTTGETEKVLQTGDRVADYIRHSVWHRATQRSPGFISASTDESVVALYPTLGKGTAYEGMLFGEQKTQFIFRLAQDKPGGWLDQTLAQIPAYDPRRALLARQESQRALAKLAWKH